MNQIRKLISDLSWPGLASLISLCCSWFAISNIISGEIATAGVFASLAFQFDVLDGILARKLGKVSEFGKQLDSFVDLVNYSLVAALLTMLVLIPNTLGLIVGLLIIAFGVLRLSFFNLAGLIEKNGKQYYQGLITCTLSFAAFLLYLLDNQVLKGQFMFQQEVFAAILTALALGQVSTIKTPKTGVVVFWVPISIFLAILGIYLA